MFTFFITLIVLLIGQPVFAWYKVMECSDVYGTGPFVMDVTLSGRDWDAVANTNVQATIVDGVVAVYEKTIEVE